MIKITKKQILYSLIIFVAIVLITYGFIAQISTIKNHNIGVISTFICIELITIFNIIRDNKAFSLNKVFWYFNFFFLFLAPLIQYLSGYYPWNYIVSDNIYLRCNFLIIMWMIIYTFVNIIIDSKNTVNVKIKELTISNKELKKGLLISAIAFIFLVLLIGFKSLFLMETNTVDLGNDMFNSIVSKFLRSIPVFSLAIYIIMRQKRKCSNSKIYLILLLILTILLNFPTSISRYWIGAVYLGLLLVYAKNHIKNRTFDIMLLLVIIVVFPLFSLFKRYDLITVLSDNSLFSVESIFNDVDFDAYSMFARIIIYTKNFGFEFGHQLLCTVFFFIPRAIWVTKPYPTGVMVATKQGTFYTNLSSPLISEGYVDFGIIGVIFYAIILAIIVSKLDNVYWKRNTDGKISIIEITYPFMIGFMLFLQRGSMQPVITHAFSFYLYIMAKYYLTKFRKRGNANEMFNNKNVINKS